MMFNTTTIAALFTATFIAQNSAQAASLRGGKEGDTFVHRKLDQTCFVPDQGYVDVSRDYPAGVSKICIINDSSVGDVAMDIWNGNQKLYQSPGPKGGPYEGIKQGDMQCIDLADYNLFRGTYLYMGVTSAQEVTLPCGNLEPDFDNNPLFQAGGCMNGGCGDDWKGSSSNGVDGALYYNPTSAATAVIQCTDDVFAPYIKCGPSNSVLFSDYEGSWEYVGGGASMSWTAGYSWSQSETDSYSHSFSYGFSEELKMKSGVPGIDSVTLTTGATQQVNNTSTQSITQANEESGSYTCASSATISNCDGSIYQWRVTANSHSSTGYGSSFVTDCSFVCVPSALPAGDVPKCPDQYCSSRLDGCQCCNSIWRSDDNTPEGNFLSYQTGGTCGAPTKTP